ncbi:MAG TPA: hypothetical protein VK843_08555 [Planctomycetota bacterium]|nr:hypothetical protein [Planctomycetota bacterium]
MKPSRGLLLAALLLVAGTAFWMLRDQAPDAETVTKAESDPAVALPAQAPVIETPPAAPADKVSEVSDEPSSRTKAAAQQLELLLLDPESHPVADARVALFRDKDLLAQATTDSGGLASFAPQQGEAKYAIAAWGWELVHGGLDLAPGRTTVTLVDDATIAGHATVDGSPAEPFDLRWRPDENSGSYGLPSAVDRALSFPGSTGPITAAMTRADGSFQFRGIRADATGALSWTAPYFLRGVEANYESRHFKLNVPRRDLVLDLVARCELQLRVVDPQGKPLPHASVKVEIKAAGPSGEMRPAGSRESNADREGRYRQPLPTQTSGQYTISVAPPNTAAWKVYPVTRPPDLQSVWDLGDLATAVRTLIVHVQDMEGNPIEGASVLAWPRGAVNVSVETDAAGTCSIELGLSRTQIEVAAFTYTSALVEVPVEATEVTAKLERACLVEFLLSDPTRDRKALTFELSAPGPMFDGNPSSQDVGSRRPRSRSLEGGTSSSGGGAGGETIIVRPEKDLRWRVSGLLPRQPLRGRLRCAGTLVCEVEVAPLAPGEHRSVTLPLPPNQRPLILRVLSPQMEPVPSANIVIEQGDVVRLTVSAQVDANGELMLASLSGERFGFVVSAKDFSTQRVSLSPIPTGRFDIVLELPQSVEIELVNSDGTPYTKPVQFSADGTNVQLVKAPMGVGLFRLNGLPAGDVMLILQGEFGLLARMHYADDARLRVVIGEPGSIEVTLDCKNGDDLNWMLEAAAPGSTRSVARAFLGYPDKGVSIASFKSLPRGEYEIWVLHAENPFVDSFLRVGTPVRVAIDAKHSSVKLAMKPPR